MQISNNNDGDHATDGDEEPTTCNANSFDPDAFHQLSIERQEAKRRDEEHKRQLSKRMSDIRWNSIDSSSPAMHSEVEGALGTPQPPNSSVEADAKDKLSARRELLRLGRRYSSMLEGEGQNVLLTLPENGNAANCIPPTSTGSPEAVSSVVTPDSKCINNKSVGVHSSHYLLLARSNSSPTSATGGYDIDSSDKNISEKDDGSSTASYSTPTPHLQATSSCDSHGELEDEYDIGAHQRRGRDGDTDHFASLCKAQVFISELEHGVSKDSENGMDAELAERSTASNWTALFQLALITIACVLVLIGAQHFESWLKFTLRELSTHIASWSKLTLRSLLANLQSRLASITIYCWSLKMMWNEWCSNSVAQIAAAYNWGALSLIRWAEAARGSAWEAWSSLSNACTCWIEGVDVTSLVLKSIYRVEQLYFDSLALFNAARDAPGAAWNATLTAAASSWQHLDSVPRLSDLFAKSQERIVIRRATVTVADLEACTVKPVGNESLAFVANGDDAVALSQSFWSATSQGAAFVRQQPRPLSAVPAIDLDTIATSSRASSALVAQKQQPKQKGGDKQPSQASVTQSYYLSSYPKETTQALDRQEKDAFDDVDVMSMTGEFVGRLLKKGTLLKRYYSNRRRRRTGMR